MTKRISVILFVIMLLTFPLSQGIALSKPTNPLFGAEAPQAVEPRQRRVNVLLLGIDYGYEHYWGSGYKQEFMQCHTDAVMVASINRITKQVSLISIPRDTIVYVPNVYGIYKLNMAFNCADSIEQGLSRTVDAVSYLLGGIQIDYYCAVDMGTMVRLCDYIGGIDFDLDMSYVGNSHTEYHAGYQHMDGIAITDYLRARKNATLYGTDLGRTGRQRRMIEALFNKACENPGQLKSLWNYAMSDENNFYTDMKLGTAVNLLNIVRNNADEIQNYVMDAKYQTALGGINFSFTRQEERIEMIQTVFDVTVDPLPYASYKYAAWLMENGFSMAKHLHVAQDILTQAKTIAQPSEQQLRAMTDLEKGIEEAAAAFDNAADSLNTADTQSMQSKKQQLRQLCEDYAALLGHEEKLNWYLGHEWRKDHFVNQYPNINWN